MVSRVNYGPLLDVADGYENEYLAVDGRIAQAASAVLHYPPIKLQKLLTKPVGAGGFGLITPGVFYKQMQQARDAFI